MEPDTINLPWLRFRRVQLLHLIIGNSHKLIGTISIQNAYPENAPYVIEHYEREIHNLKHELFQIERVLNNVT